MKNLLNRTSSLLILLVLGGLIALFAFSLKQGTFLQPVVGQTQSGAYPGPEINSTNKIAENSDPYPGPSIAVQQTQDADSTQWLTYEGEETGYVFQYRSDFLLSVTKDPTKQFGSVRMIFPRTGALNIDVLENSSRLTLEELLKSNISKVDTTLSSWPEQDLQTYADELVIAGKQAVGFKSYRDLIPILGAAGYTIFIPFDGYVIEATLDGGGPVPDDGNEPYRASEEAIELTIKVLDTLQLQSLSNK